MKSLILILAVLFSSSSFAEGIMFSPAAFYYSYKNEYSATSSSEQTNLHYDLRLGTRFSSNMYLGAIYGVENIDFGNGTEHTRTGYGLSFGLLSGGLYLIAHYFLSSEYDLGNNSKYTDGKGLQADFGYFYGISNSVMIGPQISYRSINYSSLKSASAETDVDVNHTQVKPYISLAFIF